MSTELTSETQTVVHRLLQQRQLGISIEEQLARIGRFGEDPLEQQKYLAWMIPQLGYVYNMVGGELLSNDLPKGTAIAFGKSLAFFPERFWIICRRRVRIRFHQFELEPEVFHFTRRTE